jgi:hypothetical protein
MFQKDSMIIGLLPDVITTETFLNNLAEAEFNLQTVSVIRRDMESHAAGGAEAGPLQDTTLAELADRLTLAGLAPLEAQFYVKAIQQGAVFVAMAVPKSIEAVAREMLQDHEAQSIRGVPDHAE